MKAIETGKLIEVNNSELLSDERRVPFAEILEQHRKRYMYNSSIGDILLKRITQLETESTSIFLCSVDKDYKDKAEEARILYDKSKFDDPLTTDEISRLAEICEELTPHSKRFTLPCFVDPAITTLEEYDALMGALQAEERVELESILQELTNPNIDGEINMDILRVAEAMGVNAFEDMKIEDMTAQQYNVVRGGMIKENKG